MKGPVPYPGGDELIEEINVAYGVLNVVSVKANGRRYGLEVTCSHSIYKVNAIIMNGLGAL